MSFPFTVDQFFDVFRRYNESVFPAQIVLLFAALVVTVLIVRPTKHSGTIIAGILSLLWLWMGVVYHIMFFSDINPMAMVFGGLFILQSVLFSVTAIARVRPSSPAFRPSSLTFRPSSLPFALFAYSLALYPLLGYVMGHVYPANPTFGLPCPTTIFTFGVLLATNNKAPWSLLAIPIAWAAVGISAAVMFGVWEDLGLAAAAVLAIVYRKR